jgi:hypothetical protein
MTNEQLTAHFGPRTVYRFDGTLAELADLQNNAGNSYNYIVSDGAIYYVADLPVIDSRAVAITQ